MRTIAMTTTGTSRTAKRRIGTIAALAAAAVLLLAGPASAHVTVQPTSAAKGASDQAFSFRVPNEKDAATTTQVQVFLPTDHPIPSVLVSSIPGWKATIATSKLATPIKTDDGTITDAVSSITWTGGSIDAGHYQDFTVDFGQLPSDTSELTFKALQTYSDGSVVRWIQPTVEGQPDPANPAPVLHLTDATAGTTSTSSATTAATAAKPADTVQSAAKASGSDSTARVLGGVGVLIGLIGVGFGVLGRRRNAATATSDSAATNSTD